MMDALQEHLDTFYFKHGKCCAGCDWWEAINSKAGECTKSAPMSGQQRLAMLGIEKCSLLPKAGHALTKSDHVCGAFKDEFDWTSLPLAYRKKIGELKSDGFWKT
jgi:hypothetical protein